eukprot:gb/GECH01013583.1/.p1 GENE.gb/GECH01013583.1/~~gb/GECH01013583.1/.p1  ORF type:complete len:576 (+),score=196.55 gb/GECH01013583.1/:1-1728(+)
MASSQRQWVSKEEYKAQKELEAARKAGTAPPQTDEEGNMINPHIPQYIAQAPWYTDPEGPTLKHQRKFHERTFDQGWYKRGARKGPAATKFRKGACPNCGSMTHKAKDCMDRPRKRKAKDTGKDIQPDEVIEHFDFDYDAKRDPWNGFDPQKYQDVIDKFQRRDKERRKYVSKKLKDSAEGEEMDDVRQDEEGNVVTHGADPKRRTSKPSLRIRGDTAKYLINLDPESAFYDPKTRSMRGNPQPNNSKDDQSAIQFKGENEIRHSGDTVNFAKMQLYASEAYDRGQDVHLQATPSLAETLHKNYHEKKENMVKSRKKDIIDKYGGEEHLNNLPPELVHAQTEEYVEYAPDGRVVKGKPKAVAKSRYEEDVFINNHTCVWGSYWEDGKWGFACCKQFIKNSYCTAASQQKQTEKKSKEGTETEEKTLSERAQLNDMLRKQISEKEAKLEKKKHKDTQSEEESDHSEGSTSDSSSSSYASTSSASSEKDEAAHRHSHKKKRKKHGRSKRRHSKKRRRSSEASKEENEPEEWPVFKKRRNKYNSLDGAGEKPTNQDMEDYHRNRTQWDDPMKDYVDHS